MKIAYLDCFSGVSGDMFLGALLDAGLPIEEIDAHLKTLPLTGYQFEVKPESRNYITGSRFMVRVDKKKQVPRNLEIIREIIRKGDLSTEVKDKSIEIFEDLARVEGKIHGLPSGQIHFHEVGAVDSIVDIVGTVLGIELLGITSLFVSPLPLGSGFADTAHGRIPIPAPATIALLKGVPVFDSGIEHEMVTPTGAALVKRLATSFGHMPPMIIHTVGYGAGKRDLPDRPNLLRILIGNQRSEQEVDTVVVLEANLDDTSPEWLGYLMSRLLDTGALDVIFCPVQMKKNRPGVQIQVMGRPEQRDLLTEILFRESTTLGIRFRYSQRMVLKRSVTEVDSPWGKLKVKKILQRDGTPSFLPEYEACQEIALKNNRPLKEIFYWVMGLNREKS
jgi:uncharacterized protein (TIGR00299 family) protein